jgi:hypothetical protein
MRRDQRLQGDGRWTSASSFAPEYCKKAISIGNMRM